MGLFRNGIDPEIIDLKDALTGKRPGRDTALGFALVDCKLCLKAEHGVLVNETVWGMQTCKSSYSFCKKAKQWVSDTQGTGLGSRDSHKNNRNWSCYNFAIQQAVWFNELNEPISRARPQTIEEWVLLDFNIRIAGTKIIVEEFLRTKNDSEWIMKLNQLLVDDPIIS